MSKTTAKRKREKNSGRTRPDSLSAGARDLLIGTLLKPLRSGSLRSALLAELGAGNESVEEALREPAMVRGVRDAAAAAVMEAIPAVLAAQLARALEDKGVAKEFLAAVGVLEIPAERSDEAGAAVSGFDRALVEGLREALGLPEVKG